MKSICNVVSCAMRLPRHAASEGGGQCHDKFIVDWVNGFVEVVRIDLWSGVDKYHLIC